MINLATIGKRLDDLEKANVSLKEENRLLKIRVLSLEQNTLTVSDKQTIIDAATARMMALT